MERLRKMRSSLLFSMENETGEEGNFYVLALRRFFGLWSCLWKLLIVEEDGSTGKGDWHFNSERDS